MSCTYLSIETTSKVCSVALSRDGVLLRSVEIHEDRAHSRSLTQLIEATLEEERLSMSDLTCVAVCSGPGSYTGLRIGCTVAKGLCFSLDIPVVSVSSLEVMGWAARSQSPGMDHYCAMVDARRMEVFSASYDGQGEEIKECVAEIIDENSYQAELLEKEICFFGDGAEKCLELMAHPEARLLTGIYPSAKWVASVAWERIRNQDWDDVAYFEPLYAKEFHVMKSKKTNVLQ